MRIALLGAGRIGQLHGRLVAEQPGVDAEVTNPSVGVYELRQGPLSLAFPGN